MNRSLLWRGLVILAIIVILAFAAYPLDEKLKLGLDLRGGMHLVMKVLGGDALRAETETDMARAVRLLDEEAGVSGARAEALSDTSFVLFGVPASQDDAVETVYDDYLGNTWTYDRDDDRLVFTMRDGFEAETRRQAVRQARQTIGNRVNAYGVTEPVITTQEDKERLIIQLPGVDDPERVKELIQSTAFLEFRMVDWPEGGGASSREEVVAHYGGTIPSNVEVLPEDIDDPATGEVVGQQWYGLDAASVTTGRDLKNASSGLGQFNEPVVNFVFSPEGGDKFGEATGANVGGFLAIVLDDKVVSAPRINSRIEDQGMIEGRFSQQEVQDLVTQLRSGALPAGLEELEERTVGPSLGQDSIEQGLRAGLIGGTLVILVMLIVYKGSGINAVVALSLNVVLVFGMLAQFGATLTLPGIAGIILTIGMAVDANVLVFERIREELRKGRTVRSAIANGFDKARSSILDANITTLIAALFLFQFGTGPIRGFAVTLSVGIFSSIFTALFVSRWIFDLVISKRRAEKLSI